MPNLNLVRIGEVAVREIEAETLVGQGNPVVVGVEPVLSREVVEALPDLHSNTVSRACAGIETEASAGKLNVALSRSNDPVLSRSSVAVVDLNGRSILEDSTANVKTLRSVSIRVEQE